MDENRAREFLDFIIFSMGAIFFAVGIYFAPIWAKLLFGGAYVMYILRS